MRLAISIPSNYTNYEIMSAVINAIEFTEIVAISSPIIERYKKEYNKPVQTFDIDWGNIVGAKNVKKNKFGKMYNADAPSEAAQKVVDYSTHVVEFEGGDFNINKHAKVKQLPYVAHSKEKVLKRYKF